MYRYRMYRYFHTGIFFLVSERSGRRPGSEATLLLQALCNRVSATTAVTFVKSKAGERPLLESYSLFPTVSIIIFYHATYQVPGTGYCGTGCETGVRLVERCSRREKKKRVRTYGEKKAAQKNVRYLVPGTRKINK